MAKNKYVKTDVLEITGTLDLNDDDEIIVVVDEETIVPISEILNSRLGSQIAFKSVFGAEV